MPEYDEHDDDLDNENEGDTITLTQAEMDNRLAKARKESKTAEAQAQAQAAQKELLFVKAGVDTDTKLGKLLLNSYDGELTVEAVKAEAAEVGALTTAAPVVPDNPEITPEEAQSTQERTDLALGADASEHQDPDPVGTSLAIGKKALDDGANEISAIGLAFRNHAQNQANWQKADF